MPDQPLLLQLGERGELLLERLLGRPVATAPQAEVCIKKNIKSAETGGDHAVSRFDGGCNRYR
jgi:hypothetical protein